MGWALILAATLTGQPTIDRALTLLENIGLAPNAPIATFHRLPCRTGFCDIPIARVVWATGTIEVNDASEPANRRDAVAIAGALAHEFWHLANGRDEAGAYAEQLRVLRLLNAPTRLIKQVELARDSQ